MAVFTYTALDLDTPGSGLGTKGRTGGGYINTAFSDLKTIIDNLALVDISDAGDLAGIDFADTASITGLWNFTADGNGDLTEYDLTIGDVTTPDYGILRIGDSVIGRTSHVALDGAPAYNLNGAFIFQNPSGPVTGDIEFGFLDSSGLLRFGLPSSGVGNATYNPRSMLVAGPAVADSDIVTVGYWQTQGIFHNLVCDTGTSGADLGVQNDLEVEGDIFTDSIKESTTAAGVTVDGLLIKDSGIPQAAVTAHEAALSITESQISDLTHYTHPATHPWSMIDTTPTTLAGYGITDAAPLSHVGGDIHIDWTLTGIEDVHADRIAEGAVTQHEAALSITESQISDLTHYTHPVNHPWSILTGTPTTLSGYGISDTKTNFNTALSDGSFMFSGDAPTAHTHTEDEISVSTNLIVLGRNTAGAGVVEEIAEATFKTMMNLEIGTDVAAEGHDHDSDYISVVATPTTGNFPQLTAGGELVNSTYDETSFADAVHSHGTFDRASSALTGAQVFSDISVLDGIVTGVGVRSLSHDALSDFVENEHIDWTSTTETIDTTGNVNAREFISDSSTAGVHRDIDTGILYLSGGNAYNAGANIGLYGGNAISLAGDMDFRVGTTTKLYFDNSASQWDFKGMALTGTSYQVFSSYFATNASSFLQAVNNSVLGISGSNALNDGFNMLMYGGSHGTLANNMYMRSDESVIMAWDDTNSEMFIGGTLKHGSHTTIGSETVTGYITIKDAAGTSRKLAVVS